MDLLLLAITVAAGIVILLRKARFHYERLPKVPYVAGARLPEVAVIIPAQNAETRIANAAGSFPEEIVTVVDAGSTDSTVERAKEAGVRVIEIPAGAADPCLTGAEATSAEWLLFASSNTTYARVFLPSVVEYAETEGLDMVTVLLQQQSQSLAERVLLPYASALYFCGVNSRRMNSVPAQEWFGSGHCVLIKRAAYLEIGGHGVGSPLAGIEFAKRAAAKRLKARVARAEHMGIAHDVGPNMLEHLKANPFTAVQVAVAMLLLLAWLPLLLVLISAQAYRQAAIFAVLPIVVLFPWYRGPAALLAPAAIYLLPIRMLQSLRR